MTFAWTRDGLSITTRCVLCGMSTRSLSESAIYASQRGHDAMTCQRRRAEAAYANSPQGQAETRARAGDGWVAERDEMLCATTVFGVVPGVETGRLTSGNNEPASAQTLTGSSTPLVTTRKEA